MIQLVHRRIQFRLPALLLILLPIAALNRTNRQALYLHPQRLHLALVHIRRPQLTRRPRMRPRLQFDIIQVELQVLRLGGNLVRLCTDSWLADARRRCLKEIPALLVNRLADLLQILQRLRVVGLRRVQQRLKLLDALLLSVQLVLTDLLLLEVRARLRDARLELLLQKLYLKVEISVVTSVEPSIAKLTFDSAA